MDADSSLLLGVHVGDSVPGNQVYDLRLGWTAWLFIDTAP